MKILWKNTWTSPHTYKARTQIHQSKLSLYLQANLPDGYSDREQEQEIHDKYIVINNDQCSDERSRKVHLIETIIFSYQFTWITSLQNCNEFINWTSDGLSDHSFFVNINQSSLLVAKRCGKSEYSALKPVARIYTKQRTVLLFV